MCGMPWVHYIINHDTIISHSVATMIALMVCIRFSASSKRSRPDSKTSLVTSGDSRTLCWKFPRLPSSRGCGRPGGSA